MLLFVVLGAWEMTFAAWIPTLPVRWCHSGRWAWHFMVGRNRCLTMGDSSSAMNHSSCSLVGCLKLAFER